MYIFGIKDACTVTHTTRIFAISYSHAAIIPYILCETNPQIIKENYIKSHAVTTRRFASTEKRYMYLEYMNM